MVQNLHWTAIGLRLLLTVLDNCHPLKELEMHLKGAYLPKRWTLELLSFFSKSLTATTKADSNCA